MGEILYSLLSETTTSETQFNSINIETDNTDLFTCMFTRVVLFWTYIVTMSFAIAKYGKAGNSDNLFHTYKTLVDSTEKLPMLKRKSLHFKTVHLYLYNIPDSDF